MLLGAMSWARTQDGNNNAYGQDNEISWFDWSAVDAGLLDFTRKLVAFRREHADRRRLPGPGERVVGAAALHHPARPGRAAVDG